MKNKKIYEAIVIIVISFICGIILFYQTQKVGFHEDEAYSIASSVNPTNGLMVAYDNGTINSESIPIWLTREYVTEYMTLQPKNFLNFKSIYVNQAYDNHPPFFYTMVHCASILLGGKFSTYTVFIVNIIGFIGSLIVIKKICKELEKENLFIPIIIFYGLSMGTISMVIYQRMYMLLTFFILLYYYLSIQFYKNDFKISTKFSIELGIVTVLGFLTQYYFAVYALFIFAIIIIKLLREKQFKTALTYFLLHIGYAVIGILIFIPSINHLLHSDRGLSNLANGEYLKHFATYIKHYLYAFTISTKIAIPVALVVLAGIIYAIYKSKDKFIMLLTIIPIPIFFAFTVKMTSFQELRYIMPIIPFTALAIYLSLDEILKFKYKNICLIIMSIILVSIGLVFSKPKFLFKEYTKSLEIAQNNKEKSFVYIYDNFFNHMQSVPEMMIYKKTLIINYNRDELKYVLEDATLNSEDSYILLIKSYMDNEKIIEEIKTQSEFKNIKQLYNSGVSSEMISNNIYLVSK